MRRPRGRGGVSVGWVYGYSNAWRSGKKEMGKFKMNKKSKKHVVKTGSVSAEWWPRSASQVARPQRSQC